MAVGGSSLIMALMIVFGIFWGICFGILPRQSAFVAACLSLSSTPLVAKFVESKNKDTSSKGSVFGNNFMVRLLRFILSLVCASQKSDVRLCIANHLGILFHCLHGKPHGKPQGILNM